MERQTVRVLVVDDRAVFRRAASSVVAAVEDFVLDGATDSGEQAIAWVEAGDIGLVLMDVNLPGMSGIQAAEEILLRFPHVAVILLSVHEAADLPEQVMPVGAQFCQKALFGPDELEAMWKRRQRSL